MGVSSEGPDAGVIRGTRCGVIRGTRWGCHCGRHGLLLLLRTTATISGCVTCRTATMGIAAAAAAISHAQASPLQQRCHSTATIVVAATAAYSRAGKPIGEWMRAWTLNRNFPVLEPRLVTNASGALVLVGAALPGARPLS
jgi:hypothetical protein